jgi:imidazolonepropionase-like amidohydrolase
VPGAPAGVAAFVDVNIVPMDRERVLHKQTVLVEGGRITALGPRGKVKVSAGALRIDGKGKYLLPGLADCHFHVPVNSWTVDTARYLEHRLLAWLAVGVTTVRAVDWASEVGPFVLTLRARAAAGELVSPRIYTSGRLWPRLAPRDRSGRSQQALTRPAEVAAQVAAYKAQGYDFLKFHGEVDVTTPQGRAVWDSLAAAARREGLPIVGHVPSAPQAGVQASVQAGVSEWFVRHLTDFRSIEGLEAYTPHLLLDEPDDSPRVAAKRAELVAAMKHAGVWSCPTVGMYVDGRNTPNAFEQAPPGISAPAWTALRRQALRQRALVKALHEAGTGMLLGTVGSFNSYINLELRSLVAAGLTPYQAWVTATRNMAAYLGTLAESGTVAVGKRADLVLLDDNPLQAVQEQPRLAGVMLGGRWLTREELDRRLAELKSTGAAPP